MLMTGGILMGQLHAVMVAAAVGAYLAYKQAGIRAEAPGIPAVLR